MKVLFIDDDSVSLECLSNALRLNGHSVQAFSSIESAFRDYSPGSVDMVISDYHFPSGTGYDVITTIHKITPEIPVIIISGDPEKDVENRCRQAGAYAFFKKPLSISKLLDKMSDFAHSSPHQ